MRQFLSQKLRVKQSFRVSIGFNSTRALGQTPLKEGRLVRESRVSSTQTMNTDDVIRLQAESDDGRVRDGNYIKIWNKLIKSDQRCLSS